MSFISITSTEQCVLATKSAFTPKAPAHLLSPTIAQPPIESLQPNQNN